VVASALAKLFGEEPEQQIGDDLRRFKMLMEAGEIATTEGQPKEVKFISFSILLNQNPKSKSKLI